MERNRSGAVLKLFGGFGTAWIGLGIWFDIDSGKVDRPEQTARKPKQRKDERNDLQRACRFCGKELNRMRKDAKYCNSNCRVNFSRSKTKTLHATKELA